MSDNSSLLHKNVPENVFQRLSNGQNNIQYLEDGTIEVTDHLPKADYYKSLRRGVDIGSSGYAAGLSSQLSLEISQTGTLRSGFGKRNRFVLDEKLSGKEETCYVLMLDGVEKPFTIDRNAYGIHLFDKICKELDLRETEYFGLSYRTTLRVDNWLRMDKRVSKQMEKSPWKLEFRVRFYPQDGDEFKDDLTRYCLCLQLRQDIISGQLPCSYQTYIILGAYVVQSEAGDFDPQTHIGTDYISTIPFAPSKLQTSKMLQQIVALHKLHKGQTPVQADRGFLENVRRHALYGVEFHRAKTTSGEDVGIGVYYGGILIYRGLLRINQFLWPQIMKLGYKSKQFTIAIRKQKQELISKRGTLLRNTSVGTSKLTEKRNMTLNDLARDVVTLTFTCSDPRLSKRLWDACTSQHTFFRLRDVPLTKRQNLTSAFTTRKYHYSDKHLDSGVKLPSTDFLPRQQPPIQRVQTQRKSAQYAKSTPTTPSIMRQQQTLVGSGPAPVAYAEDSERYYLIPGTPSPIPANSVHLDALQNIPPTYRKPEQHRIPLPEDHWQMSAADCTQELGRNNDGTDIAALQGAGWQGCRTNWGIKWPGAYFYEAYMLEEGQIRLGWSTNDASLILGTDSKGFGYGADEQGEGSASGKSRTGRFIYANQSSEYGFPIVPGDVIGCFLELNADAKGEYQKIDVHWSYNGRMLQTPHYSLDPKLIPDLVAFFPAAAVKDSRVEFNFGYKPFTYPPKTASCTGKPWTFIANVSQSSIVSNRNVGWRVNPFDMTSDTNLLVSPNGRIVQAVENTGWQGFRANRGIFGSGCYYYEVKIVEDSGLARIGWSYANASLDLGTDLMGYGYGADRDGFGINGLQGKKLYGDIIENYGQPFRKGDTIGCFLDLENGLIQWAKNNENFGPAYQIDKEILKQNIPIYPAASLVDTTLELNYGDLPLKYPQSDNWIPIFAAFDEFVFESPKWLDPHLKDKQKLIVRNNIDKVEVQPEPPLRTSSRLSQPTDQTVSNTFDMENETRNTTRPESPYSSDQQEDEVRSFPVTGESITEFPVENNQLHSICQSNIKQVITERSESEIIVKTRETKMPHEGMVINEADKALDKAILETTDLNPDTIVLPNTVHIIPEHTSSD